MKISKITALGSAALLSLGVIGGTVASAQTQSGTAQTQPAHTQQAPAADALAQAIAAAEAETGGKAVEADWENGMVEVELVKPDGTKVDTMFNPADGSVQVMADDNDHENGEDEDGGAENDNG